MLDIITTNGVLGNVAFFKRHQNHVLVETSLSFRHVCAGSLYNLYSYTSYQGVALWLPLLLALDLFGWHRGAIQSVKVVVMPKV